MFFSFRSIICNELFLPSKSMEQQKPWSSLFQKWYKYLKNMKPIIKKISNHQNNIFMFKVSFKYIMDDRKLIQLIFTCIFVSLKLQYQTCQVLNHLTADQSYIFLFFFFWFYHFHFSCSGFMFSLFRVLFSAKSMFAYNIYIVFPIFLGFKGHGKKKFSYFQP